VTDAIDKRWGVETFAVGKKAPPRARAAEGMTWREDEGKSILVPLVYSPAEDVARGARNDITMAEVARHDKRDDCWIAVEGHAYDVTPFIEVHPGGWLPMVNMAGKDCTDAFANYHPARVYKTLLPRFYKGKVIDAIDTPFVREHREIRQELLRRGLFETRPSFYVLYIFAWLVPLFCGALTCVLAGATPLVRVGGGGALLAAMWQQLAFIGHDVGHNSLSHVQRLDTWWGVALGNLAGGISLGWWKRSHNTHHIVCNSIEHDPDIQHMPLFAVDGKIFGRFWSSYHEKWVNTDALARALVSVQHWLFYPVMAVARFNLYVQGFIFVACMTSQDHVYAKKYRRVELASLTGFVAWLAALVWSLPPGERLPFLLLSHAIAGILHVQICISHFAMATYHGRAYNSEDDEWFKMQLRTTMNVACSPWADFLHGGLQFQIEHHLYPRLPRHALREARALVKPFAAKHGLLYHEPGFLDANVEMSKHMNKVAREARGLTRGDGGFFHGPIWEGLHAAG